MIISFLNDQQCQDQELEYIERGSAGVECITKKRQQVKIIIQVTPNRATTGVDDFNRLAVKG